MRLVTIALGAAAGFALMAFAEPAPSPLPPAPPSGTGLPKGECIRSHDIRNHTIADNQTLLLDVNHRNTYRVTLRGQCLAGAIASDPIITREPPGTSFICKPIDMDVGIVKAGFETKCIVDSIDKLTPEQIAALPKKLRP
jgi:hypothetical protein